MSGDSGWCLESQHAACRYSRCTCRCHRIDDDPPPDEHPNPEPEQHA